LAATLAKDLLPERNTPVIKLWSYHSGEIYGSGDRRFVDLPQKRFAKKDTKGKHRKARASLNHLPILFL
jgi:hypothetical protein